MPKDWKINKLPNGNIQRTRVTGPNKIGGRKSGKPAHTLSVEELQRYAGSTGKDAVRAREELDKRGIAHA